MKKILLASATVALLLAGSACSNNYDLYPDEMAKVLMIKDSGTRSVTVYSAQDKVPVSLTVLKGGVSPDQTSTATVRAMTQAEFDEYAAESGLAYSFLPANCYSLDGSSAASVTFNGGEGYQNVTVDLDVKAIGAYLEANPGLVLAPAVPLVLEATDGSKVSSVDNMVFLVPDYRIPTISFDETGMIGYNLNADGEAEIGLNLPMDNLWNIGIKVEVDPTVLDEYNNVNGTSFTLIPSSAYTLPATVTMAEGSSEATLKVKVNTANMDLLNAMPLRITAVDIDGIEVDGEASTLLLTTKLQLDASMLSTNAQEPNEGPIANVLDGNINTFFHSIWSGSISENHYIQISLPNAYKAVRIEYTNRNSGTTDTPAWFNFYSGTSNADLTLYKHFEWNDGDAEKNGGENIRGGAAELNVLTPHFTKPQSVFRIENEKSWNGRVFFTMSTLTVYGI